MKKISVLAMLCLLFVAASAYITRLGGDQPVKIPASKQRIGNAEKGFEYLTTGDYVRSGIPYSIFMMGMGGSKNNHLGRKGQNEKLPYEYTAVRALNGEILVAPNCLQCHAQVYKDQLVIGLGNSAIDFTMSPRLDPKSLALMEGFIKRNPKQYEAAAPFLDVSKTIFPYLVTDVRGVNPADKLAGILAAHRDPSTFKWLGKSGMEIPTEMIPTDTPPWWLLKKKNAMFYNGFGRGDFGRFLMASNLLTVNDTSESRQVDEHMPDVLAYIYSLEAPKYTGTVNSQLAKSGKKIFERNCASCHGTYGKKETYPNLLIPQSIIGTDSMLYKSNYSHPQFISWFNNSWFTKGDHPARLEPFRGYIAPPLDGIWLTAPYLHNGSVPTIEALLNSKLRPAFWTRDFDRPEFDEAAVGWKYTSSDTATKRYYNTRLPGYGNYGHYFGDHLSDAERKSVLEYLKTL
jgi:hypothetical protein